MIKIQKNKKTSFNFFKIGILSLFSISSLVLSVFLLPQVASAGVISMPPNNLGLVGYWSFNEGTGTVAGDHSGNGNTGTLVGDTSWVDGRLGKGLHFDGDGDYVEADVATTDANYTWSWWSFTSSLSQMWMLSAETLTNGWGFGSWNASGEFRAYSGGASNRWIGVNGNVQAGVWQHWTVVYSGGVISAVYRDGAALTPASNNSTTGVSSATKVRIGGLPNAHWSRWNGSLDEVRIYNRALSESEIQKLHQSGSARIGASTAGQLADGLVGHWTFDGQDISGTTVYDRSGQGNDGTLGSGLVPVFGKIGQAYANEGTEDLINIPNVDIFGATGKASLAFWMKNDGSQVAGARYWFGGAAGANRFRIYQAHTNSSLTFLLGEFAEAKSISINPNTWHHIVVNRDADAGTVVVYRDGVQANDWVFTPANGAAGMTFFTLGSAYISGSIDDVRIYNRVLSVEEVNQLYRLGQTTVAKTSSTQNNSSELLGHWTFDGPTVSGTTVADVSGNGNDGIMSGDAKLTYGKIGQGINFNDQGRVTIANDEDIKVRENFSISLWAKDLEGAGNVNQIFAKEGEYFCQFWSDNNLYCYYWIDGNLQAIRHNSAGGVPRGEWIHIVTTLDKEGSTWEANLYINGVLRGSKTSTAVALGNTTGSLLLGHIDHFIGDLDDFRLYGKTLSIEEVKQLYQMGR